MAKAKLAGSYPHKDGGKLVVREHPDGYEITWPHPNGNEDGHGGIVVCNEEAALLYLERDRA